MNCSLFSPMFLCPVSSTCEVDGELVATGEVVTITVDGIDTVCTCSQGTMHCQGIVLTSIPFTLNNSIRMNAPSGAELQEFSCFNK